MSRYSDEQRNGEKIKIYQSIWKILPLAVGGLLIGLLCTILTKSDNPDSTGRLMGWFGVIFGIGGGAIILLGPILHRLLHTPYIIIHNDRIDFYQPSKYTYQTIYFNDVKMFHVSKVSSAEYIAVDYKSEAMKQEREKASDIKRKLMNINFRITGSIANINATKMTIKAEDICSILNNRLKGFRENAITKSGSPQTYQFPSQDKYSLEEHGVNGYAYPKDEALKIVEEYYQSAKPILAGDVYMLKGGKIEATSDCWYCTRMGESDFDYAARSYRGTTDFINNYPDDAGYLFYFVLDENRE